MLDYTYRKRLIMTTCALSVLALASHAAAQPVTEAAAGGVEEVVVTGSRIARAGFTAPTPVTVVAQEQLTVRPLLADSLKELPTLQATTSPVQQRNGIPGAGKAQLNLRNLGVARTLVLLDGKRFVTANETGAPDVSQFPSALVDRVEVVTGGASAAYGSDAVAGVVNFVLNKRFTGFKAAAEGGISALGDNENWLFNTAYGRAWGADDRGHLLLSYEKAYRNGMRQDDRDFTGYGVGYGIYTGQTPVRRKSADMRHSDANEDGLIVSGPLKGTTFGPNSAPRAFNYGTNVTATTMIGGEGPVALLGNMVMGAPLNRDAAFGRISYDITPNWNAYVEGSTGVTKVVVDGGLNYLTGAATGPLVTLDNPYLDPTLRARMVSLGLQNFRVNKMFDGQHFVPHVRSVTKRVVAGVDGNIGAWKTEAYVTYGESISHYDVEGMTNDVYLRWALDAVRSPTTGLPVCRITLTDPSNKCVPYNVMGPSNVNSQAAIDYINGTVVYSQRTTQTAGGINVSGDVFDLPAGRVSLAVGSEFRRESFNTDGDDFSNRIHPVTGAFGWWRSGNQPDVGGSSSSKEVFAETVVPVFKDLPFGQSFDINAAGRITDYRLSGTVETWKIGATWQVVNGLRFRATRSRDIREPTLGQLYSNGGGGQSALTDTVRNNVPTAGIQGFTRGNLDLRPESADTLTYGVVLQPGFAPGLAISVDRYDIDISDAISGLGGQGTVDECAAGGAIACSNIVRNAAGTIIVIYNTSYNLASRVVKGYDIESSYRLPLDNVWDGFGGGSLTFRALATYLGTDISAVPGAAVVNRAGEMNIDQSPTALLKWRANASITYNRDDWRSTLNFRYVDKGVRNVQWISGVDIDDNTFPAVVYADLQVTRNFELGDARGAVNFTINNLMDKQPSLVGTDAGQSSPTSTVMEYDYVGRAFRLGVNFQF